MSSVLCKMPFDPLKMEKLVASSELSVDKEHSIK